MTCSPASSPILWLIRDTFRQALSSGIFWLMLGMSALTVVTCLTVEVIGDRSNESDSEGIIPRIRVEEASRSIAAVVSNGASQANGVWQVPASICSADYQQVGASLEHVSRNRGQLQIAGGAIVIDIHNDRAQAVRTLQLQLAGWIADSAGLLLALIWTAGFLPNFLEAGAVAVLLVKPMPRWALLTGKCLGVLLFFAFQTTVFIGATWLALGCRTGVWDATYFLCIPVLLIHFSVFFSFSVMLAVATRSTTACVFGSVVFWLLCWAMNYGRHTSVLITELQGTTPVFGHTIELGYWVLPKPLDFHIILLDLLKADNLFTRVIDTGNLTAHGVWSPMMSIVASVTCALLLLFVAAFDFVSAEY